MNVEFLHPIIDSTNIKGENAAKKICENCIVKDACLERALSEEIVYGVWGGIGERERRIILRGIRLDKRQTKDSL